MNRECYDFGGCYCDQPNFDGPALLIEGGEARSWRRQTDVGTSYTCTRPAVLGQCGRAGWSIRGPNRSRPRERGGVLLDHTTRAGGLGTSGCCVSYGDSRWSSGERRNGPNPRCAAHLPTSSGDRGIMNSAMGTILESGWPCGSHDPSGRGVGTRIAPGPIV